jgi:hypothetical protein
MSMGEFGKVFDNQLREAGFEVYTYVAGGATPYYWLERFKPIGSDIGFWSRTPKADSRKRYIKRVPKVEHLITEHRPDIVVVQTGTNLYASLRSKRRAKADNVRLVAGLCADMAAVSTDGSRKLFWIAPPKSHVERYPEDLQKEMESIMESAVTPYGEIFKSRDVTEFVDPYPKTDGIHYGAEDARDWAKKTAGRFVNFAGVRSREETRPPEPLPKEEKSSGASNPPGLQIRRAVPVDPGGVKWGEIDVTLRLKRKTELPPMKEITYQSANVLYEYEVLKVNRGYYPYDTLNVAHLGVYRRKPTAKARYELGVKRNWRMMPLETYAYLQRLELFDDFSSDPDRPIYVIKLD